MQTSNNPTHLKVFISVDAIISIGLTKPQVPIPAETPVHFNPKTAEEIGPVIAEARVGAIHILGFFTMLPIWSIEVPRPWAISPDIPFTE